MSDGDPSITEMAIGRRRLLLRRPSQTSAIVISIVLIAAMAFARLYAWSDELLPIGFGVPLLVAAWLRSRTSLWLMTLSFVAMTIYKTFFLLSPMGDEPSLSMSSRAF